MTKNPKYFTSESVSEGNPDKLADRISDAILDACLEADPMAKVACETMITGAKVVIAGEIYSVTKPDNPLIEIARKVIRETGYTSNENGFDCEKATYLDLTRWQSPEVSELVANIGPGNQGTVFGYASDETPQLMPLAITISHEIIQLLSEKRKSGEMPFLRPDAKAQVTIRYEYGKPCAVDKIILSVQHDNSVNKETMYNKIEDIILRPVLQKYFKTNSAMLFLNPCGKHMLSGTITDTGVTGRKVADDTYGGACPNGDGALSGKDTSKLDRSGAYMARYIAKHIVAAGLAKRCTVQLSYGTGINSPLAINVDLHGTSKFVDSGVKNVCSRVFNLTPLNITERFGLRQPIFYNTAVGGHFGRAEFPWEKIDSEIIKSLQEDPETGIDNAEQSEVNQKDLVRKIHESFAAFPTDNLVDAFNNLGKSTIVAQGIIISLMAIHKIFLKRNVDCELINIRNESGRITGCRFTIPIKLEVVDGKQVLVELLGPLKEMPPVRWINHEKPTDTPSDSGNETDDAPNGK